MDKSYHIFNTINPPADLANIICNKLSTKAKQKARLYFGALFLICISLISVSVIFLMSLWEIKD